MTMKTWLMSILLGCSICNGMAQAPFADDDTTNALSVSLWIPNKTNLKAPATVNIQAYVRMQGQGLKAGDSMNVEFFSDSKSIGSAIAVWHDTIRPHAAPGQAVPMWIMPAGFYPAQWTWTNAPAGNYTLTAQATWTNGLSAVSMPVGITVASP
jgi:hypothetical protein